MLEGKALIEETDMPLLMQMKAVSSASHALNLFDVTDCKSIATHVKTGFDKSYGCGWQCVVGAKFGCYFTHAEDTFIYCVETLNFLVFKGVLPALPVA